ncbi:MAG: protein-L-isoaspartate O-methyltransferase, partial [Caulobacterales bacterium]
YAPASLRTASWRSGYAEECKSLHPVSFPVEASKFSGVFWSQTRRAVRDAAAPCENRSEPRIRAAMDFARARAMMVESQVRPSDVTDVRVIEAMKALPRERFVPAHMRQLAYADLDLEVSPGRFLLRPREAAKLIQALAPQSNERALEIACATAYGAAVLAACVREVYALDVDPELSFAARAALESSGVTSVKTVSTGLEAGWAEAAPYDVILVNGAVEVVPDAWIAQLAENGRLGVIVRQGAVGSARIYTRSQETVSYRVAFDSAPPVVPGLERPRVFSF